MHWAVANGDRGGSGARRAPRLLTSNIVFKKCGPTLWLLAPLLRNPGDGLESAWFYIRVTINEEVKFITDSISTILDNETVI